MNNHDVVATHINITSLNLFLEEQQIACSLYHYASFLIRNELVRLRVLDWQVSNTDCQEAFAIRLAAVSEIVR